MSQDGSTKENIDLLAGHVVQKYRLVSLALSQINRVEPHSGTNRPWPPPSPPRQSTLHDRESVERDGLSVARSITCSSDFFAVDVLYCTWEQDGPTVPLFKKGVESTSTWLGREAHVQGGLDGMRHAAWAGHLMTGMKHFEPWTRAGGGIGALLPHIVMLLGGVCEIAPSLE